MTLRQIIGIDSDSLELRVSTVLSANPEWPEWVEYNIEMYANRSGYLDVEDPDNEVMIKVGSATVFRFLADYGYDNLKAFDMTQDMYNMWVSIISEDNKSRPDLQGELLYDLLYLPRLEILPLYQGQGLGAKSIELISEYLGSGCGLITLHAKASTYLPSLVRFYERLGFTSVEGTNTFYKSLVKVWSDEAVS